jgi:nitrous oxidase accessory protein
MRILLIFLLFLAIPNFATTIEVCASCTVKSIGVATKMAKDGDTILVKKGIYLETNIQVSHAIHIIGEGRPIIDAENKQESIFAVKADNFSISGFEFRNVGMSYIKEIAAIFVSHSRNFVIKDNIMNECFYGIILQRAKYGLLQNNIIKGHAIDETSSGNGIHLWKSNNIRIDLNTTIGMRDGIYLEFVDKTTVSNNTSRGNIRYGLHYMFSNNCKYHHNEFRDNGAGVAVMYSKFIKMHHNTFHYNWGTASYGLLLKEINDADIESNYFEKNTIGINVDTSNRINYRNNHFVGNGWAVIFNGGSYDNTFEYNNFLSNAFDLSYHGRINNNKFDANHWSDYTGYDLDKDGIGDVPHRPVKLFSYIVNKSPDALVLLRSLFIDILNFSEKVSPIFTPDKLVDNKPIMTRINDQY